MKAVGWLIRFFIDLIITKAGILKFPNIFKITGVGPGSDGSGIFSLDPEQIIPDSQRCIKQLNKIRYVKCKM